MFAAVFDSIDMITAYPEKSRKYILIVRNSPTLDDYTTQIHNSSAKVDGNVFLRIGYLDNIVSYDSMTQAIQWKERYGGEISPNSSNNSAQIHFLKSQRYRAINLMEKEGFKWD